MPRHSEEQRQALLGLGSHSARKSHYPELLSRLEELETERNRYKWLFEHAVHGIFQASLQAGQLQGAVEADGTLELAALGEALLEVVVGEILQDAAQAVALPFQLQLAAIVVAPAAPALQLRQVRRQPALELRPDLGEGRGGVDLRLADMGQLAAEGGQAGAAQRPDEALEGFQLVAGGVHQGGADLDDFHVFQGPAAFLGGGLQVDD